MDRLTSKITNGYVFGPYFIIHDHAEIKPIVDRLGAYEDTGLTPEEIASLEADMEAMRNERDAVVAEMHRGDCLECMNVMDENDPDEKVYCPKCRHGKRYVFLANEQEAQ